MLVDPGLARDQVLLFPFRLKSQQITTLAIQNLFPDIGEIVIIATDRSPGLTPVGGSLYFMIEKIPDDLFASLTPRRLLDLVVLAGRRLEIHCRDHVRVGTRTLRTEQTIFAKYLVRQLRMHRRLCFFHSLDDRVEREPRRNGAL